MFNPSTYSSSVFLPLRSNAAWFASPDHSLQLERRLKNLLMVYDELVVQDGRYHLVVEDRGILEAITPPDKVHDRTVLDYKSVDTPFSVQVATDSEGPWHPLIGGPAIAHFEVDFFPLFHRAGIVAEPYLRWKHVQLSADAKTAVEQAAQHDLGTETLRSSLPEGQFLKRAIVQGFYGDSLLSSDLRMPLSTDYHVSPVIDWKNAQLAGVFLPDIRFAFQHAWLNLRLPDVAEMSWHNVHTTRQSAAGRDYRKLITQITADAASALISARDAREIQEVLQQSIVKEVVSELLKRRMTLTDATISFGLNLMPVVGGYIGTAKDLLNIVNERRSWVALLGGFHGGADITIRSE